MRTVQRLRLDQLVRADGAFALAQQTQCLLGRSFRGARGAALFGRVGIGRGGDGCGFFGVGSAEAQAIERVLTHGVQAEEVG